METELRMEEESEERGAGILWERDFLSLLEQWEKGIFWKTNASKQSRGEADGNAKEEWKR